MLVSPLTIPGSILPISTRWYPRLIGAWSERETREFKVGIVLTIATDKHAGYKEFNAETFAFVPLLYGEVIVMFASPELTRTMLVEISQWPKPEIAVTLK